jgi:hypothetical protein
VSERKGIGVMEEWSAGCAGRAKLRLSRFKLTSSVKVVEDWSVGVLEDWVRAFFEVILLEL